MRISKRTLKIALVLLSLPLFIVSILRIIQRPQKKSTFTTTADSLPFLKSESDLYLADPVAEFVHRPNAHRKIVWPEHPRGTIEMITNNLGLREDRPTEKNHPATVTRMLVVGDSHIDGVLYNSESFPHRLEGALKRANQAHFYEILNAGTGYYGPQNYAGALTKWLDLHLDVFVTVVYSGNDFSDALRSLPQAQLVVHPPGYFKDLESAVKINEPAISQALNQIFYFKHHPEMEAVALKRTFEQLERIQKDCERNGIRHYAVLLPTKLDVEWNSDRSRLERASTALALSATDLKINEELRTDLGRKLITTGIRTLDATSALRDSAAPAFWREIDYHLNVTGHDLLADAFLRVFGSHP